MRIIQNVVIGGLVIFVGFIMYPPYINYIYTPIYNLVKAQFPSMPPEQEIFWKIFPFVILCGIIVWGIMWIIGKRNLPGEGGGTPSEPGGG